MILSATTRIWLYQKPVDMRRSFDGLAAIAQNVLSLRAASGDWFVFINRRRTQMKILYFDVDGYCIWAKRLERGRYQPVRHLGDRMQLDRAQLQCLISGLDWQNACRNKRFSRSHNTGMVNCAV
jgi:transposase